MTNAHARRRRGWLVSALVGLALLTACAQAPTPTVAPPSPTTVAPAATTTIAPTAPPAGSAARPTPLPATATIADATAVPATTPLPSATAMPTATVGPASTVAPTVTVVPGATGTNRAAAFVAANALRHVEALASEIGARAAGTVGEVKGADYLTQQLTGFGYQVTRPSFPITRWQDGGATLTFRTPVTRAFQPLPLQFSGAGQVSAPLVAAGRGTPAELAASAVAGKLVLVERGEITFADKARNARAAGAAGLVIYNNQEGSFQGSLGAPLDLPVVGLSRADGLQARQWLDQGTPVEAALQVNAVTEQTPSQNVVAVAPGLPAGLPIIVVGGHYDGVPAGPGANDNASGTAVLLEIARLLADERRAEVRFVGFGAEEIGLVGSRAYVAGLSRAERERIVAMINLDMFGVGPTLSIGGSDALVTRALAIAREIGVANPRRMSGNGGGSSDHASFIAAGIPAVFLNRLDDPNYHTARDQAQFISQESLRAAGQISLRLIDDLLTR